MIKSHQIDMTQGAIFPKLLEFSVPLIFSSILQLLFNAADIVVVGRFAGDNSLAAVGSTGSLINLLVNLFMGLSIGTNVLAANYFGQKNKNKLQDTVHTSMLISVISGIILTIIGVIFTTPILEFMQTPEEVLKLASIYLRIYFYGITSSMIYNFGSALLRAQGDTKRPLLILLLSGIVNIILNLIFVINFKLDVAGVAYATVISQTISAIIVVIILLKEDNDFKLNLKKLSINPHIFAKLVKIGVPAGFQGIMFSFSNIIIQSAINSFGPILIAGNSAAISLEGFVYTSMNGFSQGALTFTSQNLGAGKKDRIKKVVIISQFSIIVIGLVLGWLGILFDNQLLSIYSKSPDVINAGKIRVFVIFSTYFLCGIMDAMANSIRGCGHSLLPAIVTIFCVCFFRIFYLATFFRIPQFHSPFYIFISYPVSWFIAWIIHLICFIVIFKKIK